MGPWCLEGWQGPEHFRPMQGGIHGNLVSRNLPHRQLPTGTVTLKADQWKNTHLMPYLPKMLETSEGKGRLGARFTHTLANNPQQSALNRSKLIRKDQAKSARICLKHFPFDLQ